jgi:hypothetical protein
MLSLASEEKFFSFHRISSIQILPLIGTILLLTLLQIYLLLSLRLQVKVMEETVDNLKKTDQVWGLKGLILCRSIPVWSTRRISATCDIIIWARFGGGIRLAFSARSAITFVFSARSHVSV